MLVERRSSIASQVTTILAERIRTQTYAPGSRLPSESELAVELGVSRATLRSALSRLAAEGLVLRKQGDGTYVNARLQHIPTTLSGLWDLLGLIERSGRAPSIRVLAQTVRAATEHEMEALALEEDKSVFFLRRVLLADDTPAILAENALPLSLLQRPAELCDGQLPINEFIVRYCHTQIAYGIFDIDAILPDSPTQALLRLEDHNPLLRLRQVFYDRQNEPLLCGSSSYNEKLLGLRLVQSWS